MLAVSLNLFCKPNNIVSGGVSGLSIVLYRVYNIDSSTFVLISDMILLIVSYFALGKEKTLHSVLGSIIYPVFIKLTTNIDTIIPLDNNPLLAVLFAGVIHGIGSGLIFKAGFSVGGTDILNQTLSKYLKISIGNAMFFTDGVIILISGFVFGITNILYALILLYMISYIADRIILGVSDSKAFYIVTNKNEEVKEFVINELKHSVTELNAEGGFKGDKEKVLMCVLPTREYFKLKEGINKIDKKAFFVVTDAYEVVGGA